MKHRQEPPFAVQVELTEGCNLYCSFCALRAIREKPGHNYKFMTKNMLISLMKQMVDLGWNPRLEAACHGEPSLHPERAAMIGIMRQHAPKFHLMMTSNGGGLLQKPGPLKNVQELFDAGLNTLALDDYENVNIVPKIKEAVRGKLDGVACYDYPEQPEGNPHRRHNGKIVSFIKDISISNKGTHATLNNHASQGAPPVPPDHPSQTKRCAKVFRELTVRWNGDVAICCNDFRGVYKCGNIVNDGLDAVWNGAAMQAARQYLIRGERQKLQPCAGCDAISYRVGLLPDKLGKAVLPRPGPATARAVAAATAGPPYTAPVPRPWE